MFEPYITRTLDQAPLGQVKSREQLAATFLALDRLEPRLRTAPLVVSRQHVIVTRAHSAGLYPGRFVARQTLFHVL